MKDASLTLFLLHPDSTLMPGLGAKKTTRQCTQAAMSNTLLTGTTTYAARCTADVWLLGTVWIHCKS